MFYRAHILKAATNTFAHGKIWPTNAKGHFSYNSILCYLVSFCEGFFVRFISLQKSRSGAAEHEGEKREIIFLWELY